ncbi:MAG: metallophosphoesterase family protein [Oscillospiraceae bacterium]|jgi:predicted MPP superfamily phosphohydrolase|nr:metallophosphoesterase family protein [Oscillospiraceae bacterium]
MAAIAPYMERLILDGGLWDPRPLPPYEYSGEPLTKLERFFVRINGPIDAQEIETPIRALPADLDGYRAAIVSDTHLNRRLELGEEILRALMSVKPDLICLLGDLVDAGSSSAEPYKPFLRALAGIAPCAAVMGNNDYVCGHLGALRAYCADAGIPMLEDESRTIKRGCASVRIIGLQDANAFAFHVPVKREAGSPGVSVIKASLDPSMIDILLIHRPHRAARTLGMGGFALALSGHAHGGQWRLPNGRGLFAPGQGLFPKYTSGLYRIGGGSLIVGRGLGNHEFPVRINNRPHIPVAILRRV